MVTMGGSLSALFVKVSILKPSPWTQGAAGWLGGWVCVYSWHFFWEHLELWNLEHGTLGTLPSGSFFRFSKFSNLTPPGQFLTFFWPTFLKAVAFFFGWSKSLALLDSEPHGGSLEPPFWIFQKYAFLHPWRTPDGFRFLKIAGNWPFLTYFLKSGANFFLVGLNP